MFDLDKKDLTMKHKGFSLIELLIVMVIIGLMVGVVAANLGSGNPSVVLNTVTRDISSALRFARGHALTHRKETVFEFNLEKNSYRVTDRNKTYTVSQEVEVTLDIAESQISDDQHGAIRFFPDGSSTGGRITLEIADNKRQLDINWLTGQVNLEEL